VVQHRDEDQELEVAHAEFSRTGPRADAEGMEFFRESILRDC